MDSLRQYAVSVVCAALICSVLSGVCQNGPAKELIRLLCGLFLTLTVIRPISNLKLDSILEASLVGIRDGEAAVMMGEEMAYQAVSEIIKDQTEAYIMDKATELNANITVDITVEEQLPVKAKLCGEISPYARDKLQAILEADLGITKENQLWTG